jgi:hypothetical protein
MKTRFLSALCSLMLIPSGIQLFAQDPPPADPQNPPAAQQRVFPPEQLDSLVAPIALYPDSLLSQVLVASTYPLELVEANQWLQQNGKLQGTALVQAAQQQNWDPSIQALVPFSDVIKRLTSDIRWTTDLGNAFLAQQSDVMAAVQRMRARARDSGKLTDTPQQQVVVSNQGGQSAIEIQPTDPQVVYVPVYNPDYFWGPPLYPWPGLYYPAIGVGWGWGFGIQLGLFFPGCCGWGGWGWGFGWFGGGLYCNNYFFHRYSFHEYGSGGFRGNTAWVHDPAHRLGVPYANRAVAQRFGAGNVRGGAATFRGSEARGGNEMRSVQQRATPGNEQNRSAEPRANNHSAFGGVQNGSRARVQSDHGFSSMGPSRTAPAFHGGGGGGFHGGGGRR